MTLPEELDFDSAAARIARILAVIAVLGTLSAFAVGGWKWGAGFLLGSLISELNYRWLRRMMERLGPDQQSRRRRFFGLRYLLLGAGAYVILRYSSISLPAVLVGLFVLIAAVFVEVMFELVYARK